MKKLKALLKLTLLIGIVYLAACKKADVATPAPDPGGTTGNADVDALIALNASESFNYETANDVTIDITLLAPDNTPIKFVPVSVLNKADEFGGKPLFKNLTDANGKVSGTVKLPAYMEQVVVDPKYLGLLHNAVVNIVNKKIICTIGGSDGYSGNVVPDITLGGRPFNSGYVGRPTAAVYSYMGTYNNQGKPNYLESTNQTISSTFLSEINASLPERMPVPTYHPDYIQSTATTNINITATTEVKLTFVTEGAGYRNTIAYFKYPTNNPPATANDIDTLKIVLPNASMVGSSGQLVAGNTVNLGTFTAGTTIGFCLIANGWNGTNVGNGYHKVYSVDAINPQSNTAIKRQSVLLYDNSQKLFLVGFEDIRRDDGGCDNDFNDCVFYIKSTVQNTISTTGVKPIDIPVDSDGDGVNDTYDDFPHDAARAYVNYFPNENSMGTVAFEDNWPYLGDYDANDLVVGYRYKVVSNNVNKPIEMNAKYILKASGATFKNGFGVEFPFAANLVTSATGSVVTNNQVVTLGSNGLETGQTKAVIIPFDDAFVAFNTTTGFINTYNGITPLTRDTISMNITFARPLTTAEFGTVPFNPFIIINRIRGREAHLPGYLPTQKIDTRFYKTGADNTTPNQNKYFKTTSSLPWGIAFSEEFAYPVEGKAINTVYTKFPNWVQSNGSTNTNWYKDAANTVTNFVYHR
jgi:LruC domain-containing protein